MIVGAKNSARATYHYLSKKYFQGVFAEFFYCFNLGLILKQRLSYDFVALLTP
jgi:hypothetical protein